MKVIIDTTLLSLAVSNFTAHVAGRHGYRFYERHDITMFAMRLGLP